MEHDISGGGVQPVLDDSGAATPFFPVTRRDRLLCVLLVSVILVCGYHAARDLSDLASAAEPVQAVANAESDTMVAEEVPFVSDEDLVVRYDEQEGAEVVELPDNVRELYGLDASDDEPSGRVGDRYAAARLASADGRFVYESTEHRGQSSELQQCRSTGELRYHDCESEHSVRAKDDVHRATTSEDFQSAQEEGRFGALCGGDFGSAVFGLSGGDPSALMRPAAWYGGVGVRAFSWLQTKAATSTVGQKLAKAGITPLLAMSLGIGGFDVAVTAEEVMAREEVVMVEAMETQLANRAIMADAGEEVYVLAQRLLYNAENGISMSASETVAAACSDFEAACTTGVLPTATHATLESALLSAFTEGCMSVGALQPLAAIGEQLMEMCDLTPVSYADANGYLVDGSSEEAAETYDFDDGNINFKYGYENPNLVPNGFTASGWNYCKYIEYANPKNATDNKLYWEWSYGENPTLDIRTMNGKLNTVQFTYDHQFAYTYYIIYKNGKDVSGARVYETGSFSEIMVFPTYDVESWGVYYDSGHSRKTTIYLNGDFNVKLDGVEVGKVSDGSFVYNDGTSVPLSSGGQSLSDFFESGGQVVGNDAQFGDDGELVDAGTVNVTPALYGDTNPSTWADALAAGEVNAVKPEAESPTAGDEVVVGEYEGKPVSEAIGKVNPPTVPQLQFAIDGNLGNIQDSVSEKFPFSIPFNVSRTVNLLIAEPEAPHFTWVFAVPTGDVEYEVDLAPFSPVAHVLRVMLDVLMVFVVISLLGKIAQVWGFFDRSAD